MDPIMRKWLMGLKPEKTELDWQNRGNKQLNETIYGIIARTVLHEDLRSDMDEFKKRYQKIHGIEPDQDTIINAGKHLQKGGSLDALFPNQQPTSGSSDGNSQESVPGDPNETERERQERERQERESAEFRANRRKIADEFGEKFKKFWKEKTGRDVPENVLSKLIDHVYHSKEYAAKEWIQLAWKNIQREEREKRRQGQAQGQEKVNPDAQNTTNDANRDASGGEAGTGGGGGGGEGGEGGGEGGEGGGEGGEGGAQRGPKPKPQQTGLSRGAVGAFGLYGAAETPQNTRNVVSGLRDLFKTGVYGFGRLGGKVENGAPVMHFYDKKSGQYREVSPTSWEGQLRSASLGTQDLAKLTADTAIAAQAAGENAPAIGRTSAVLANSLANTIHGSVAQQGVPSVTNNSMDWFKDLSKSPVAKSVQKFTETGAEVANKIFPVAATVFKGAQTAQDILNGEYGEAAKHGIEGGFWGSLATQTLRGVPAGPFTTVGVGHEMYGGGLRGLYGNYQQGNLFSGSSAIDTLQAGIGAAMTQADPVALKAWKKTGETLFKTGTKAAAESGTEAAAKAALEAAARAGTREAEEAILKAAGKEALEIGAKSTAKGLLKQIPVAGLAVGGIFAAQRAWEGDWLGAGLELAGGVPIVGLAAQGALAIRDVNTAMEKARTNAQAIEAKGRAAKQQPTAQQQPTAPPGEQEWQNQLEKMKDLQRRLNLRSETEKEEDETVINESVCIAIMRRGLQNRGL